MHAYWTLVLVTLALAGCGSSSDEGGSAAAALRARDEGGWRLTGFPERRVTHLEGAEAATWWDGRQYQVGPATADFVNQAGTWRGFWLHSGGTPRWTTEGGPRSTTPLTPGWNLVTVAEPVTDWPVGVMPTELATGVPGWVFSTTPVTLRRHQLTFTRLQANALRGRPFAVQVEARRPDGSLDRDSQGEVTLQPGGQRQKLEDGTALFPLVVLSDLGPTPVSAWEDGEEFCRSTVQVVGPPPGGP